jgi:hypothetical protein
VPKTLSSVVDHEKISFSNDCRSGFVWDRHLLHNNRVTER